MSTSCADSNSTVCLQLLNSGFCSYSQVQTSCPLTCKICIPAPTTTTTTTTSLQTTTTSTANPCKDFNSTCPLIAAAGNCNSSDLVKIFCPLSCKICSISTPKPTITVAICNDTNTETCLQFGAAGYCSVYTSVQAYCPFTCKVCSILIQLLTTVTTTTAITTTVKTGCNDTNSAACSQYAAAGYCSIYTSVQAYCPVTCKVCSIPLQQLTTRTTCVDSNTTLCSQYLAAGYCATYASVQTYCPVSCNTCQSTSNTTKVSTPVSTLNGVNSTLPNGTVPSQGGSTLVPATGAQQVSTTTKRNIASNLKPFLAFFILFLRIFLL